MLLYWFSSDSYLDSLIMLINVGFIRIPKCSTVQFNDTCIIFKTLHILVILTFLWYSKSNVVGVEVHVTLGYNGGCGQKGLTSKSDVPREKHSQP